VSKSNAAKAGESKAVEAKVSPAKPAESKVAVSKVSEAKTSEPKAAESKATDNKATDSKPAEAKSNAGKVGDNKANEPKSAGATKATESKSVESKSAEPKSAEPKSADSAAAGAKAGDSKSLETKAAVTKTNESKNAEAKSAESKPSERKLVERGEPKGPKATDTKQTKTTDPKPSVVSSEKDADGAKARVKATEDKAKPIARPADPKTKPARPPARPIAAAARIPVRAPQGKPAPRPASVPTSPNPLPLESAFAPGAPFAAEESVNLAPPLSLDALSPSTPSIASNVDADTFAAPETATVPEISGPPPVEEELVEAAPIDKQAPEEASQADSLAFESAPMVDVADVQASLEVVETAQPAEELPNAEEPATLSSPPLVDSILVNDSDPGEAPVEAPPAPAFSLEPEESSTDPADVGSAVGEEPIETKVDLSVGEDGPTENGSSAEAFTSDSDAQLEDSGQLDDSNALNGFDEDDEDDGPVIYLADGNRKCIWHPCQNAARPNSKYCSRNCSNKNARARHAVRKKTRRKPLVSN
jgi:hypothetical protein